MMGASVEYLLGSLRHNIDGSVAKIQSIGS